MSISVSIRNRVIYGSEYILCSREITITKEVIEGMKETIRNLYLADEIPWVIGYSGGKDSTAALQLVWLSLRELPKEKLNKTKAEREEYVRKMMNEVSDLLTKNGIKQIPSTNIEIAIIL